MIRKHAVRNALIIAFFLTGLPLLRRLFVRRRHGALVRVIVFHGIADADQTKFRSLLRYLKKHYAVIGPQEFVQQQWSRGATSVVLTFDDGLGQWMRTVVPALDAEGLHAVFFLNSGTVGTPGHLSWDDVRAIAGRGHVIGGHTVSHRPLAELPDGEAIWETQEDRRRLEEALDTAPQWFAYPFGDRKRVGKRARRIAQEAGYRWALMMTPGFNHRDTPPFWMFRDALRPTMPRLLVRAWLAGSYDTLKNAADWMRRR